MDDKEECEIEDLFDKSVLEHSFAGKVFSRKGEDSATTVSKDIFFKYISQNYATIDFKKFKPMLNAINDVIQLYTDDLIGAIAKS